MTLTTAKPPRAERPSNGVAGGVIARFLQIVIVFGLMGGLLFGAAGRLDWPWAWLMLVIYAASVAVNLFFLRHNAEMVAERGRPGEVRRWDQVISGLWGLAQYVVAPLAAGLDLRLGGTPPLGTAAHLAGALAFVAGLELFGWAMITNAYFSTAVRIQTERGHQVCRSGPYQWVRHPGYVGAMVQSLAMPLLLGSAWALVPGVAAVALMVARTALEDRTLQAELPGYREYAQAVRWRLVPGVW